MKPTPDKQTPTFPRGLLLAALALIAILQIVSTCSNKNPETQSPEVTPSATGTD